MKNKVLILAMAFIFLSVSVFAAQEYTLIEGEVQNINLDGKLYSIEALYINEDIPLSVIFLINDERTTELSENQQYTFDNKILIVTKINPYYAGEFRQDSVTFSFKYCGDKICGNTLGETCSSCSADCGCLSGSYCSLDVCKKIECGDNICSKSETCENDSCCDGKDFDLKTNRYHCGKCNIQCKYGEECEEGLCVLPKSCGDGICDEEEKDNCDIDCKLEEETEIIESIVDDKCSVNEDCDDNNMCTIDTCEGNPKKCIYQTKPDCNIDDSLELKTTEEPIKKPNWFMRFLSWIGIF